MSTSREYIQFVLDQLDGIEDITFRKMFGEYMIYARGKPVLLVCDDCVMVKKLPQLAETLKDAPEGIPYKGAKPHYILDIENRALAREAVEIAASVTPIPKRKSKKA